VRKTHTREFCAPVTAANQTGWANLPAQSAIRNPKFAIALQTSFAPPGESFAPRLGRNSDNFALTATHELAISKRLARAALGRNSPNFAPNKKKKF
jgi:hypothetical protein